MEDIVFNYKPWIGPHFENGYNGKKILIVGESFYKDHSYSDMSLYHPSSDEAIRKYLDGMKQITLDNITSIVTGIVRSGLTKEVKDAFWNHTIMYNFIQDFLRESPQDKNRIPVESIKVGKVLLLQVLEKYRPNLVLICSKQVWKYYDGPGYSEEFKKVTLGKTSIADFKLTDNSGVRHQCIGIHHPSCLWSHESKLEIHSYIKSLQIL